MVVMNHRRPRGQMLGDNNSQHKAYAVVMGLFLINVVRTVIDLCFLKIPQKIFGDDGRTLG